MDIKKMRYKRLVTHPTRAEEGCPETCSKQNIRFLVGRVRFPQNGNNWSWEIRVASRGESRQRQGRDTQTN